MPKIKNIIIFLVIAAIFVLIYIYFIKPSPDTTDTLVSSSGSVLPPTTTNTLTSEENSAVAREFLTLLLSVKNVKLDDSIFSDNAFIGLHDSSIILIPDGNEGRINPFAPIGNDATTTITTVSPPICALPTVLDALTNTCVNPPLN